MEVKISSNLLMKTMSEEGKFRVSVTLNVAILVGLAGGWTMLVQKYDEVRSDINDLRKAIEKVELQQTTINDLRKFIEAESQHRLTDEQRQMGEESKVDALTTLLNEFMGTIRTQGPLAKPAPSPTLP